jgi:BA14K-like protein
MKSRVLALGAFGLFCLAAIPASAAQVSSLAELTQTPAAVERVQYRRGYAGYGGYRGGYGYRRYGYAPWIGLGAGIAAGAFIYSQAYLPRRGYYYDTYAYDGPYYYPEGYTGDRKELCSRYFKSFEWRTGMYTTYGGERRLCPYLRD